MPTASISSNRVVLEGRPGQTTRMQFVVQLSAAATTDISIDYRTEDSSKDNGATAGIDYTAVSGTLKIPKGRALGIIEVPVLGDAEFEGDEVFNMVLFNPVGTSFGKADSISVEGTIKDDEPVITVADASVVEGQAGETSKIKFTVRLSAPAAQDITVNYRTEGSTKLNAATDGADEDYIATSGQLKFAAGQTTAQIYVTVNGDNLREGDEVFNLVLSDAVGAGFAKDDTLTVTGTIIDDEPVIMVADAKMVEGNSGTSVMQFFVKLAAPVDHPVTFKYHTENSVKTNTAVAGTDYTGVSGSVTITGNKTGAIIEVPIIGNTITQGDRVFSLVLSDADGAGFAKGDTATATGTIVDDDPIITVADAFGMEGKAGATTKMQFKVSLSRPSSQDVTVKYKTVESLDSNAATQGSDYTAASGVLTIKAGQTSAMVDVSIIGDNLREGDETLNLILSNATNAAFAKGDTATAKGTIRDDEPLISINSPTVIEGKSGDTRKMVFLVQLNTPATSEVSVDYQTQDATSDDAATQGLDYTPVKGTLKIPVGWTTGTIEVPILGDALFEGDEVFELLLSKPVAAGFAASDTIIGVGTIKDDEPVISGTDAKVVEGVKGAITKMLFNVRLSNAALQDVSFKYQTVQSASTQAATPGKDFTSASGSVTIKAGMTAATISVDILDDSLAEGTETFNLVLSDAVGGGFAKGDTVVLVGTILDNEPTASFG